MTILSKIFNPQDYIYTGTAYHGSIVPVALNDPTKPIAPKTPLEPFYALNALDPHKDHTPASKTPNKARRADLNVTTYTNFLLEMDLKPLDWQLDFWSKAVHKPTLLIYSGSKSYHAIYSLSTPLPATPHTPDGVAAYKLAWQALASLVSKEPIFDKSCKNPSRLTRMPGFIRDGVEQKLIAIGPKLEYSILEPLIAELGKKEGAPVPAKNAYSGSYAAGSDLKLLLPVELYNRLKYPKTWAAPAGLYPELLRLTLWAIDACGVGFTDLIKFMETNTFPGLLRAGYPASKLYRPVKDAYKMKGLI